MDAKSKSVFTRQACVIHTHIVVCVTRCAALGSPEIHKTQQKSTRTRNESTIQLRIACDAFIKNVYYCKGPEMEAGII